MAMATRRVVREIPRAMLLNITTDDIIEKTPVAAYARVSTEREEQEDSFERQVAHYTALIQSKSEWNFVGIYADPGITGTRAEKRPDFMRMISDCRAGKIKKILVKSISRFARNTVDALTYIRELKEIGVGIYFESENIDTLTPGGEVLITILAAMAEQESRTMSSNIKWAYAKKFKNGEVILNTGLMLGYTKVGKDEEGRAVYEINEAEAKIVRRIYREFVSGLSVTRICRGLEADGIPTKLGRKKWQHSVIESILTNEKYTGDAILGKTFKPDVLSKHRIKNEGQVPMYYAEGTHPAIIDKELFELAKAEMARRKGAKTEAVGSSKFTSKYTFSGMLICGKCGSKLRRHTRRVGSGKVVPAFGCSNRIVNGRSECDSHHINEDVIVRTYLAAIRTMAEDADEIIEAITEGAEMTLQPENAAALERIETEIIELQQAVLELHKAKQRMEISESEYASRMQGCKNHMILLEKQQAELRAVDNRFAEIRAWLNTFAEHTKNAQTTATLDAIVIKALVDHITMYDEYMEITFKCGASIEQKYEK